jgi:hypothetical protein
MKRTGKPHIALYSPAANWAYYFAYFLPNMDGNSINDARMFAVDMNVKRNLARKAKELSW